MNEEKIMKLITQDYSWEQVLYKIIAIEALDPWDLSIKALSENFVKYITKMEELDFKIPAKYIIIAAVLLRMKSDHLEFIEELVSDDRFGDEAESEIEGTEVGPPGGRLEVNPITIPPKRFSKRKITVEELVNALRKALKTEARRRERRIKARGLVQVREDDVSHRIKALSKQISEMLNGLKEQEVKFSSLIEKWERKELVNTFLPLVYLDHQKRVSARQEDIFEEIFIRKPEVKQPEARAK
jgi:segregation and condensation protein A